MKLRDWADKQGITYLTAYRWFRDGKMPVNAYQTSSGTIIVEDGVETTEPVMQDEVQLGDMPVAQLIKKAVEISKAGGPVEDLATFVISNFKLEKHDAPAPARRSSKMKPTKEMTDSHFKKFLKADKQKPVANMFLVNESDLASVVAASEKAFSIEGALGIEFSEAKNFGTIIPSTQTNLNSEVKSIVSDMNNAINPAILNLVATPKNYTSDDRTAVFGRTLAGVEIANNSTLSAANSISSAQVFNTLVSSDSSSQPFDYSLSDSLEVDSTNEVSTYKPVTYDEARVLVDLITPSEIKLDILHLDRQAKELCKLNRDTFDMMLKMAKGK